MPNPTLAEFAEAFETIWQKWPDAPRLPDEIIVGYDPPCESEPGSSVFASRCSDGSMAILPDSAAIALCCVVALKIGAWWEHEQSGRGVIIVSEKNKWGVEVWHNFTQSLAGEDGLSLESACLAALRAIGGCE